MKDGRITERGTYKQLVAMKGAVAEMLKTAGQDSGNGSGASSSGSSSETSTVIEPESSQTKEELEEIQEQVPEMVPIKTGPSMQIKPRTGSMATLRRASSASFRGPRGKLTDEELSGRTKQQREFVEQGKVKWSVYGEYAKENNLYAVAVYLVTLLASQAGSLGK